MRTEHQTRRAHGEEGIAMVTAMLVTFIVFLLSAVVIQQAIHNNDGSALDRNRLSGISAAEAGLDWAYNKIEGTESTALWTAAQTGTVGSGPGSVSYTVTPTYYANTAGTVAFSGTPGPANYPLSVKITSVGTAVSGAQRRMETFMVLDPVAGGFNGAIITNNSLTLSNSFNLSGNSGNDADIIVNAGNFSAPSGLETIRGNIYVPAGTALVGTQVHVYGSVWARDLVTVNHTQAVVDGDVKSSNNGTTVSSGLVSGRAYYCTGSAPSTARVPAGSVQTCALGLPPSQSFPLIQFNATTWGLQGYYVKDFTASTCATAIAWVVNTGNNTYNAGILGTTGGVPSTNNPLTNAPYTGAVAVMPSGCQFNPGNNTTVHLGTNLAVVASGGIDLGNNSSWIGDNGTKKLFFMSPYNGTGANCPTQNVTMQNLNSFTAVEVSLYSPCTVTIANNSGFSGQVIGGTVSQSNQVTMTYKPVLIPGMSIIGFQQDIAYIREVPVS
ncbi:MAG: hypothetical protein ABI572_02420 [Actinomycetota bacterium]